MMILCQFNAEYSTLLKFRFLKSNSIQLCIQFQNSVVYQASTIHSSGHSVPNPSRFKENIYSALHVSYLTAET